MTGSSTLRVFRYDPDQGGASRYDSFRIPASGQTTVLDALAWIQNTEDPTLAFRYSCRVGMCGTCAMVVNGQERWTCRTRLIELNSETVTVRPLYHFPLVKDLVVDMAPFESKLERVEAALLPASDVQDFAPISPASDERQAIDPAIECIGCGACVSACTMVGWQPEFPGPAALLRAFTLVEDSRDRVQENRLTGLLTAEALWHCRTQLNCTAVCPMELNPAEVITRLKRRTMTAVLLRPPAPEQAAATARVAELGAAGDAPRRRFLQRVALALAGAVALPLAGLLGVTVLGRRSAARGWARVGPTPSLEQGRPYEVHYEVVRHEKGRARPIQKRAYLVRTLDGLVAFDPQCTHLGCATRWDETTRLFLCPCHGGGFDHEGRVVMGPPPRSLKRLEVKEDRGTVYLWSD